MSFLPVVYVIFLVSTVTLCYAVYGRYYGEQDTKLAFNLDDPVCFNPEFHHQFLRHELSKLPPVDSSNLDQPVVHFTKLHLSDGVLDVSIPMSAIRFQTQSPDEELCVASAHDVTLERVGQVPYVYGADVSVAGDGRINSRMIVARGNLRVRAISIEADGLLANGDVEINCSSTRITRVSGLSYSLANSTRLPSSVLQAFKYRRYDQDVVQRKAYVATTRIAENSIVTDNVVCGRDLSIGANSTIHGAVKVYGSVRLTGPVIFLGPVVVNGDFNAPEGCVFMSDVVVKGDIKTSGYLVAGQPSRHSVCVVGRNLYINGPVIGSGTMVASEQDGLRHAA